MPFHHVRLVLRQPLYLRDEEDEDLHIKLIAGTELGGKLGLLFHENDTLFINEVVDMYFSTPTSIGGYLRRLAEEVERKHAKIDSLKEELALKRLSIYNLRKWLIVAAFVAVVMIIACVWLVSHMSQPPVVAG